MSVLDQHIETIRRKSAQANMTQFEFQRKVVIYALSLATLTTIIAACSVALAWRTASSVVVRDTVRTVDQLGQTIGVTGAIYRVPVGSQTHAILNTFLTDVFTIVNSPSAMQRNYLEAQSVMDQHSPVYGYVSDFWNMYSPYTSNAQWNNARAQEHNVEVTSLLDRGAYVNGGGEEFEAEWTVKADIGGGHLGDPKLYKGDIVVQSGLAPTDANPWGVTITRFAWEVLK